MGKLFFTISRSKLGSAIVGFVFQYCTFALPVRKVYSSPGLFCFYHPAPIDEPHILLVPKRRIRNLIALTSGDRFTPILAELLNVATTIVPKVIGLNPTKLVLIANGGPRQEVGQVHFHLLPERRAPQIPQSFQAYPLQAGPFSIGTAVDSRGRLVIELKPTASKPSICGMSDTQSARDFAALSLLDQTFALTKRGYSLVLNPCNTLNFNGPAYITAGIL